MIELSAGARESDNRWGRTDDGVALTDVGQRPRRVVRVGSGEQVDAGAPDLLPLAELVELGARRDQHLAGPVADLGEEDAGGLAVGEKDAEGLPVTVTSSGDEGVLRVATPS